MGFHTPGPWTVDEDGDVVEIDATGYVTVICEVSRNKAWLPNAHVLAAAPELLEACQALISRPGWATTEYGREFAAARNAVAKALGSPAETEAGGTLII